MLNDTQRAALTAYTETVLPEAPEATDQAAVRQAVESLPEDQQSGIGELLAALDVFGFTGSSVRSRAQILRTVSWASSAAKTGFVSLTELVCRTVGQDKPAQQRQPEEVAR